jgi:hypothetical protein
MELARLSELKDIERVDVVEDVLRGFEDESSFTSLAVRLLGEAGARLCVAANVYREEKPYWTREEAIIGGHVVRLHKLIGGVLLLSCEARRELAAILVRLVFECGVNLAYLLRGSQEPVFEEFIRSSLAHEKKLMERIQDSVESGGGEPAAIERRMLRSIRRSFDLAGVDPEEVDSKRPRTWGAGGIYARAKQIGWQDPYLAGIGGLSHNVHGSWQDLIDHHVAVDDQGRFRADSQWHPPRPQYLTACAIVATHCAIKYLAWLAPRRTRELRDEFRNLQSRVVTFDRLHEQFLSGRGETE